MNADQSDVLVVASPTKDKRCCSDHLLTDRDPADQSDILVVDSPTKDDKYCSDHPLTDQDPVVSAPDLETPYSRSPMTRTDDMELQRLTTNCIEIEMQSTDHNSDSNLGSLVANDPAPATPSIENVNHDEVCNSAMEDTDAAHSYSNPNATVQLDQSPFNNNSCSSTIEEENDMKLGV